MRQGMRPMSSGPAEPDSDEKKLDLLKALSPSSARAFEELQDPSLSRDAFFSKIDEANQATAHYRNESAKGPLTTIVVDTDSGREVRIDFSRRGWVEFSGRAE